MNMNDYKNAVSRIEVSPGLKAEIMKKCIPDKKIRISKNRLIPVFTAAVIACITVSAVFAGELAGIFKKDTNFEMNISNTDMPEAVSGTITDNPDSQTAGTMPVYKAELKKWDESVINDIFGKDKKILEEKQGGGTVSPETFMSVCYDDGSSVGTDNGYIFYSRGTADKYNISNPFNQYNLDFIKGIKPGDNDKESPAIKKAAETADSIISRLGINAGSEKNIYSYNEDLEAYAVLYRAEYGGTPFGQQDIFHLHAYDTAGWHTDGVQVYAIIDKYGIAEFSAYPIYEITESKGTAEVCTPEKAAEVLADYFDKNIPGYKITINECRLIYHAAEIQKNEEYEIRPYWEFPSVSQTPLYGKKQKINAYKSYYIDAETLEMLTENGSY